jgi:hypothetical protein
MVAELRKIDKSLYETDYNLWVLETVSQLQRRDLDVLDWENLIEEVIDLSRRDRRKLESLCMRLIEHLLIYQYWQGEKRRNQGHWQREIANFRKQIKRILEDSPSLNHYLQEKFPGCYEDGRDLAAKHSQLPLDVFPAQPLFGLERWLDERWFP